MWDAKRRSGTHGIAAAIVTGVPAYVATVSPGSRLSGKSGVSKALAKASRRGQTPTLASSPRPPPQRRERQGVGRLASGEVAILTGLPTRVATVSPMSRLWVTFACRGSRPRRRDVARQPSFATIPHPRPDVEEGTMCEAKRHSRI
jgi:hypothetical protein